MITIHPKVSTTPVPKRCLRRANGVDGDMKAACFSTVPTSRCRSSLQSPASPIINTAGSRNYRSHGGRLLHPLRVSSPSSTPFRSRRPERLVPLPARAMASPPRFSPSQVKPPGDLGSGVDKSYEVIRAHQENATRLSPVQEVRTLLNRIIRGMLSTFSQEHEGYPSGSMVDFACDIDGSPILAVSSLAVHSKNLLANPKCSLLVARDPEDRTDLVVTLYGYAISVSDNGQEAARTSYLKKHPNAFWVDFGDFHFIRIEPKAVQYVSGVATALLGSGVLTAEEYRAAKVDPISEFSTPITSHMNKDHADDTKAIVRYSTSVQVDSAYMLDVDSLGFNVKAVYEGKSLKLRIPFPRQAVDRKDVKTLIVEMLQAARASAPET